MEALGKLVCRFETCKHRWRLLASGGDADLSSIRPFRKPYNHPEVDRRWGVRGMHEGSFKDHIRWNMGYTRNVLGFFQRSYSIYSRMAVTPALGEVLGVLWCPLFKVTVQDQGPFLGFHGNLGEGSCWAYFVGIFAC